MSSASAITPIVFCASFAPCVNANERAGEELADPERPVRRCGRHPLEDPVDREQQDERAREGDRRRRRAPGSPPCAPDAVPLDAVRRRTATSAAPIRPPISACDELDGSPSHHVTRFQAIAPMSAASTRLLGRRGSVSMIPWPTVFATAVVTNAPARFATGATTTASRGDSARVETDVATAFAVSWKPFVKSNAERDDDHDDEEDVAFHARCLQRFLTKIASSTSAAFSQASTASSSRSWMSFQRMIVERVGARSGRARRRRRERGGRPRPRARAARSSWRLESLKPSRRWTASSRRDRGAEDDVGLRRARRAAPSATP